MSKVYVLTEITYDDDPGHFDNTEIIGIVSNKLVAEKWQDRNTHDATEFELDDPELLNRIAKEGNKK